MFHSKKATFNRHDRFYNCIQGDSGLVLTADPKPRLRWTVELHERFVEAITQLGGPDKATPKTILKIMGVKGLTLYHLKSHLQAWETTTERFQLPVNRGQQERSVQHTGEVRWQMEVRRQNEELELVQKHLQMRSDAHGKYMQTILEKAAAQSLSEETPNPQCYKYFGIQKYGNMEIVKNLDFGSQVNFLSLEELQSIPASETAHMEKQWKSINIENLESPMVIWFDDLQPDDIVITTPDFHSDGDSFKD